DVSGLFALQFLVDRGKLDKKFEQTMYTTYLASMFRSIRFGLNEAHGRGVAMQLNYFLDHGGVTVAPDGTFAVNPARIKQNVVDLTRDIMTMQAVGDYAAAKQMIAQLAVLRPPVQRVLDRLSGVPVDIEPRFVTAPLLRWGPPSPDRPDFGYPPGREGHHLVADDRPSLRRTGLLPDFRHLVRVRPRDGLCPDARIRRRRTARPSGARRCGIHSADPCRSARKGYAWRLTCTYPHLDAALAPRVSNLRAGRLGVGVRRQRQRARATVVGRGGRRRARRISFRPQHDSLR